MKLLRHILSHLILISFLIAVVSVFYYRTLLLPADVVGKIDGITNEIYPPALKFVSKRDYFWSIQGERIVSFDDFNLFEKEDTVDDKDKSTKVAKVEEAQVKQQVKLEDKKAMVNNKEINVDAADVEQKENKTEKDPKTVVAKVDEAEKTKKQIVENIEKTNKVETLPVIVKDINTSSERDLLISARNAFNKGAVSESEKLYIELTQLDNDNPDTFGELGNVYYSQGKWDEAGQAYYEAAVRLITEGNYNQVVYLQRVIKGLNTEHAEKLSQLMMRR